MNSIILKYISAVYILLTAFSLSAEEAICSEKGVCYQILQKLGEGAFGEVYKVRDDSGAIFAMKKFKTNETYIISDAEKEYVNGMLFESKHIVKSFDLLRKDSDSTFTYYVILEYIPGKTIFSLEDNTLPVRRTLSMSIQLMRALKNAYSHDLTHMDLHPGNVMLSDSGDVKVIDLSSFATFDQIADIYFQFAVHDHPMVNDKILLNRHFHVKEKDPLWLLKFPSLEFLQKHTNIRLDLKRIAPLAKMKKETITQTFQSYPYFGEIKTREDALRFARVSYLINMEYMIYNFLKLSTLPADDRRNLEYEVRQLIIENEQIYTHPAVDFTIFFDDMLEFLRRKRAG